MNFDLSDDQRLLADSLARLLADRYGFEWRRAAELDGWSAAMWRSFVELGLPGLPFAEAEGGFGGGAADIMVVMEASGRHLVLEPLLGVLVLAATALRHAASDAQREVWVPAIAEGVLIPAWAHAEASARHELAHVATTARQDGEGWRLDGTKTAVLHGADAGLLIVSARVSGPVDAPDGLMLFAVEGEAAGLERVGYQMQDGRLAADLVLDRVRAEPLAGDAWTTIEAVQQAGIAASCADALGTMEAAQALTIDYLKTRKQFGRTIGTNQALQHRAAEMLVEIELARSMTLLATASLDEPDARQRALDLHRAKLVVGRAARTVGQQAVQLHGGIGVTEEYQVGHCLRRLLVFEQMFGDTASHLALLAETI